MRMTDAGIRNLKGKAQRYECWEDGRTGFGVRVAPSGRKTFVYMYWKDGKARRMTLGVYGNITLAGARVKYAQAKKALEEGRDPAGETVEQRRAERAAETVTELVDAYMDKWARPRKRSAGEDERILRKEVVTAWGRRKAKDIKRKDIIALLDKIVDRGAGIQANRTLACVRRMFNWACERDLLDASPCTRIKAPAPENTRDRALNDEEIRTFWHGLESAQMSETIRLALKFQLVTAQRKGEIVNAEWHEIDLDNALWVIPASRAKNGVQHAVPLSPLALDTLAAIEANAPESACLFPSPRGDHPLAGTSVDHALRNNRELIGVDDVTPHDSRRTAATRMAGLGVDRLVLSKVLNHVDRSVTGRYDTHHYIDEKRAALERWGRRLEEIITDKTAPSKVVELAAHRE